MRQALIIVVRTEQPDLREAAIAIRRRVISAARGCEVAPIGIFADVARNVVPIGATAHLARITRLVVTAFGPGAPTIDAAMLGGGALDILIPGFGKSVVRRSGWFGFGGLRLSLGLPRLGL